MYVFLLMQFLFCAVLFATRPLVSLYADSLGVSITVIGMLVSLYAFFPMLLAMKIGKLLDLYGARKITLFGFSLMLAALGIPILLPSIYFLFISQILMGLGQISVLISLTKTFGNLPGNRDKLIAQFSLAGALGELIGPLIGGYSYQYFGFQASYAFYALLIVIALITGFQVRSDRWGGSNQSLENSNINYKTSALKMLSNKSLRNTLIISGLVVYSKDLLSAYFPVYGTQIGLTASTIGLIISFMAGMAIVIRLLNFRLVAKFGRSKVLTATIFVSGIAYILITFTSSPSLLALLAGLLGIGLGLGQPLSIVYVLELTPAEHQGEALGMRLVFNRGFQFSAPLIYGAIGGMAGLAIIFLVSGGVLLIGAYLSSLTFGYKEVGYKDAIDKGTS